MYVIGEGLGKTSTTLSSGLTCSFWLISCWCQPRMYVMGKGLHTIFTVLRYYFFFFYSQQLAEKYIFPCLKSAKWVIFLPASDVYVRSFFLSLLLNNISTTQSSEWLGLSLVPELNLLLWRPWIRQNTVSFHLSSVGPIPLGPQINYLDINSTKHLLISAVSVNMIFLWSLKLI